MADRLESWDGVSNGDWPSLVVGNGLSINVWSNFAYSRLLQQAQLNHAARQLFTDFKTENFEMVLEGLWHADRTLAALGRPTTAVSDLYKHVQSQLVQAVQSVHVPWDLLPDETLTQVATAMGGHRMVFTLNYDLLTYWAVMVGDGSASFGDFFWSHHNTFALADSDLSPGRTGLLYLHGGVHLWQDSLTGYTGKWTRQSTGRNLLSSLTNNFDQNPNRRPLLVSEGTSAQKMAVIRRSDYLSFARRCLLDDVSDTVIFGASFGSQDKHVVEALDSGPRRRFAISIFPTTEARNVSTMAHYRAQLPRQRLRFFDSRTHPLGHGDLVIQTR
jgi:hypothetical protein